MGLLITLNILFVLLIILMVKNPGDSLNSIKITSDALTIYSPIHTHLKKNTLALYTAALLRKKWVNYIALSSTHITTNASYTHRTHIRGSTTGALLQKIWVGDFSAFLHDATTLFGLFKNVIFNWMENDGNSLNSVWKNGYIIISLYMIPIGKNICWLNTGATCACCFVVAGGTELVASRD